MTIDTLPLVAGTVSTVVFAGSMLPMVLKAARSHDLASYSLSNIVLSNVGNAVHSVYVFHLPPGPIWALHSFYVVTALCMLYWHLRYVPRPQRSGPADKTAETEGGAGHQGAVAVVPSWGRSGPTRSRVSLPPAPAEGSLEWSRTTRQPTLPRPVVTARPSRQQQDPRPGRRAALA